MSWAGAVRARAVACGAASALLALALALALGAPALALEPDEAEYVFVSDLLARGFTPFGTSGTDGTMFGMTDGREIYLCVSADNRQSKSRRQEKLDAEIENESPERAVPNIAVACILTQ